MYTAYQDFVRDWSNPSHAFVIATSGSTGESKQMVLTREKMKISVGLTASAIPNITKQTVFCCLPTNRMGGFMQIVRAVHWEQDVHIVPPQSNPMLILPKDHAFENISISPMQLAHIMQDALSWQKLLRFKTILIGGAAIAEPWVEQLERSGHEGIYATYGMTETYGHVALRKFPEKYFKQIDGVQFQVSSAGQLSLRSKLSDDQWIITQDIVEKQPIGFSFLGRTGNVINSGGLKISAEKIEQLISNKISDPFYITGKKHDVLGEEIVLVVEHTNQIDLKGLNQVVMDNLGKYTAIKRLIQQKVQLDSITGKIKRIKLD